MYHQKMPRNVPFPYNAPQAGSYQPLAVLKFISKFSGFSFQVSCSCLILSYAKANPHTGISITDYSMAINIYPIFFISVTTVLLCKRMWPQSCPPLFFALPHILLLYTPLHIHLVIRVISCGTAEYQFNRKVHNKNYT